MDRRTDRWRGQTDGEKDRQMHKRTARCTEEQVDGFKDRQMERQIMDK